MPVQYSHSRLGKKHILPDRAPDSLVPTFNVIIQIEGNVKKNDVSVGIKIIKFNPYEQNIESFSEGWNGMSLGLYQSHFESVPSPTLVGTELLYISTEYSFYKN